MSQSRARQVVRETYDLFKSGNITKLLNNCSEDITYHIKGSSEIPYAGTYQGKQQVSAFYQKLENVMDISKFEVVEMICEESKVCVVVSWEAMIKPTQTKLNATVAHVVEVKNGKICNFWDFADTHMIHEALYADVMAG